VDTTSKMGSKKLLHTMMMFHIKSIESKWYTLRDNQFAIIIVCFMKHVFGKGEWKAEMDKVVFPVVRTTEICANMRYLTNDSTVPSNQVKISQMC
jgi:hypothetical protein